jgi:hypothetical protein
MEFRIARSVFNSFNGFKMMVSNPSFVYTELGFFLLPTCFVKEFFFPRFFDFLLVGILLEPFGQKLRT